MPPWEKYAGAGGGAASGGGGPWSKYADSGAEVSAEPKPSISARASGFLKNLFGGAFGKKPLELAAAPIQKPLEAGANIIRENPEGALEALPAIAGTAAGVATGGLGFLPAIAAAGGAGAAGEIAKQEGRKRLLGLDPVSPRQPTIPFTSKPIPDIPGIPQRASRAIIEGGLQAGPEALARGVGGLFSRGGAASEKAAVGMAERTQGFRQSNLSTPKSYFEGVRMRGKAASAAKESLERGDIPLTGSPYKMEQSTLKALDEGTQKVDSALKTVRASGKNLSQEEVDGAILKAMNPKNEDELAAALKIERSLKDTSEAGNISVDSLTDLRRFFGQKGFRDSTVDTATSDMYRSAWKATSDSIRKLLGNTDPGLAKTYAEGLRQEEKALTSLKAIGQQIARIEGNEAISLPGLGTKMLRRGMAPASVAAFRGGKFAKDVAPLAQTGTSITSRGPGFLAAIQASAKRALERDTPKKGNQQEKRPSFLATVGKRAGERILSASIPFEAQSKAFNRIMSDGSPQSMADVESTIKSKFPSIYASGKTAGKDIRRILQDIFTLQGSPETIESLVKDIAAKRKNSAIKR